MNIYIESKNNTNFRLSLRNVRNKVGHQVYSSPSLVPPNREKGGVIRRSRMPLCWQDLLGPSPCQTLPNPSKVYADTIYLPEE